MLAEVRDRLLDAGSRIGGKGFQIDHGVLLQRRLQVRHRRARGRAKEAEGGFGFDGECDVAHAQDLLLAVERRLAPDMHGRLGAEAKPAFLFVRFHQQRDQQPVARRRDFCALNGDPDRAAAIFRERTALELRFQNPVHFRERHVDRHADTDAPLRQRRHDFELGRERTARLVLVRDDAAVGLYSKSECQCLGVDARLRRERARRTQFKPETGQSRGAAAERDRTAHLRPFLARYIFQEGVSAQPRLQGGDLLVDRLVEQRLHFLRHIELDPRDRDRIVAHRHLAGEIGLEPPIGRDRRPRGDGDIAAEIGALVERLAGEAFHLAAEIVAEQARDLAAETRSLRADLSGDAQCAVQTRRQMQAVGVAIHRQRRSRDREADLGFRERLAERIVGLAREIARRRALEHVADRGQRHRDRRDDDRGARDRRQRRHFGQRRETIGLARFARPEIIHGPEADGEGHRHDKRADQHSGQDGYHAVSRLRPLEPSVPIPKFASFCGTLVSELRNRRTLATL